MAKVARKQVNAEKKRLIEARNIANSEKRLYVKVAFGFFSFVRLFHSSFSFLSFFSPFLPSFRSFIFPPSLFPFHSSFIPVFFPSLLISFMSIFKFVFMLFSRLYKVLFFIVTVNSTVRESDDGYNKGS